MRVTSEMLAQRFGAGAVGGLEPYHLRPGGLEALPVLCPATQQEAAEMLRSASREGWRVLPAGAGEHWWELPLAPLAGAAGCGPDLVLSTQRLTRVVEYEPEEMVLVAEAGVTLRALAALAAPHAQRLPCDVWPGRSATLGGAVAANRAGPDRLRRGTLREAVLGARVLHADGSGSKTGGKVVKNVTGYDLGKLYVGSRGALAWITEVNLRLVPQPAASSFVVATVQRDRAEVLLLELHRSSLLPVACLAVCGEAGEAIAVPHGQLALVARFEGNEAVVRAQAADAVRLWGGEEWPAERAAVAWAGLAASLEGRPGGVSLRIASLPVDGLRVLECLEECSAWARGGSCAVQFGAGIASAHLPGDTTSSELAALRARLEAQEARLTLLGAPAGLRAHPEADAGGLDAVAQDLAQRTKQVFDPLGILPPYHGLGGWK